MYYRIAQHYQFAISSAFSYIAPTTTSTSSHIILLEDDMLLAPDFFGYMLRMRELMESDDSIMCASAWNDHGQGKFVPNHDNLNTFRTDCFPGLGWMLSKQRWNEWGPKWTLGYVVSCRLYIAIVLHFMCLSCHTTDSGMIGFVVLSKR